MNNLNRAVIIISKILEVLCWISVAVMGIFTIILLTGHSDIFNMIADVSNTDASLDMSTMGFSLAIADNIVADSIQNIDRVYAIFFMTGMIAIGFIAMVFRNIYLIFKTSFADSNSGETSTRFTDSNIRTVREIGIFCISIPVIEIIMSILAIIIIGIDNVELSVDMTLIVMGLVVLCLSQLFAEGARLQKDVDGLL